MNNQSDAIELRTRLIIDTNAELERLLAQAAQHAHNILSTAPSDYQRWYLPGLQAQIKRLLIQVGGDAATLVSLGQLGAWDAGESLTNEALEAATIRVVLPKLSTEQLQAMRHFSTGKISSITVEAANSINDALAGVVMGLNDPFSAIKSISSILQESTYSRAQRIVNTELARAFSIANQAKLEQSAQQIPGLQKKWLKSGKPHPRAAHVAIDGQIRPVKEPFLLYGGRLKMMHPHDPSAPIQEVINCGCVSMAVVPQFGQRLKRGASSPKIGPSLKASLPSTFDHEAGPAASGTSNQLDKHATLAYFTGQNMSVRGDTNLLQKRLNANISLEQIAHLLGSPDGGKTYVKTYKNRVDFDLVHPWLNGARKMYLAGNELNWDGFFLKSDAPDGAGTIMGADTLLTSSELGIEFNSLNAWGPPNYNGHYTWARLGFNASFSAQEQAILAKIGFQNMPDLRTLISSEGGRVWWKSNGWSKVLHFDTRAGSADMKYLEQYLKLKGLL